MAAHPPRIGNQRKRIIASIAAPPEAVHAGHVSYTRWAAMPLPRLAAPGAAERLLEVRDGWFGYEAEEDARQRVAATPSVPAVRTGWWVNFADAHLFGFYGEGFFAQDEVQVAEHPALAAVRQALLAERLPAMTIDNREPTPVLVAGVERRVAIDTAPNATAGRPNGIYGGRNLHAVSETALRAAIRPLDPPTRTNVIAIAALAHGFGPYTHDQIDFTLRAAYTGFRAAVLESRRLAGAGALTPAPEVVVHSGFWGCGAFGGNRVMMTLLQLLAAQMAGLDRLVYHVGEPAGRVSVGRAIALVRELTLMTETPALVERVQALGLEWGSGDGN